MFVMIIQEHIYTREFEEKSHGASGEKAVAAHFSELNEQIRLEKLINDFI